MSESEISKEFTFSASHRLKDLPDGHPCARLHGHNYTVRVTLTGQLDRSGMVLDYGELASFKAYLDSALDHRHLGCWHVYDGGGNITDVAALDFNPTAENLATHLLDTAVELFGSLVASVEVRETDKVSAVAFR